MNLLLFIFRSEASLEPTQFMPPPSHTAREKACSLSNEDGELGDDFLSFPTFFSLLQRKHLLRAGMALLKIIKEKVWREKVNKVIHASSAGDTKVRQREIIACAVC